MKRYSCRLFHFSEGALQRTIKGWIDQKKACEAYEMHQTGFDHRQARIRNRDVANGKAWKTLANELWTIGQNEQRAFEGYVDGPLDLG